MLLATDGARLTILPILMAALMSLDPQGLADRDVDCPRRDAATKQPDLVAFRSTLKSAVARRDAAAVLKVTDPNIRTSFGPDDGLRFFKRALSDRNSETWKRLERVLASGGFFETPDSFVAPFWIGCGEPGEEPRP